MKCLCCGKMINQNASESSCEIPSNAAERMLKKICSKKDKFLKQIEEAYLSEEQKEKVKELVSGRIEILQ